MIEQRQKKLAIFFGLTWLIFAGPVTYYDFAVVIIKNCQIVADIVKKC